MGDGTPQDPLTREDVLKAIKDNGDTARGLNLFGNFFESGIDLRGLDLDGIQLQNAVLLGAQLQGTLLREDLQLLEPPLPTNLKGVNLLAANLEGAQLQGAHLEGATLAYSKFSADTRLEEVDWGNYILRDEINGNFRFAIDTYRRLKVWYKNAGISDIQGEFLYREMKCKRKQAWWGDTKYPLKTWFHPFQPKKLLKAVVPKKPVVWALLTGYDVLCGYGERIRKILLWIPIIIFGCAAAYHFLGSLSSSSFLDTLYYSAASFTALGYGQGAPQPTGWAKAMGAAEAFIGVFMMALLLVTFVRKMTR